MTKASEMVQRAADAIHAAAGDEMGEKRRREVARAVIAAMREPTEAMINAGWEDGNNGYGEGEEMAPIWRAMIDEALR